MGCKCRVQFPGTKVSQMAYAPECTSTFVSTSSLFAMCDAYLSPAIVKGTPQ